MLAGHTGPEIHKYLSIRAPPWAQSAPRERAPVFWTPGAVLDLGLGQIGLNGGRRLIAKRTVAAQAVIEHFGVAKEVRRTSARVAQPPALSASPTQSRLRVAMKLVVREANPLV